MMNVFEQIRQIQKAIDEGQAVLAVLEHLRQVKVNGKEVDAVPVYLEIFTNITGHINGLKAEIARLEAIAGDEFAEIKAVLEKKE